VAWCRRRWERPLSLPPPTEGSAPPPRARCAPPSAAPSCRRACGRHLIRIVLVNVRRTTSRTQSFEAAGGA
jgi:hypothetical protein